MAEKHERKETSDEVKGSASARDPKRFRPRLATHRSLSMQHNVSRILPFLFVGGKDSVDDETALRSMDTTHIINCTADVPNFFQDSGEIAYLRIAVPDSLDANIADFFAQAFAFIDEAKARNGVCLVHCSHGMSRSATIAIAYLIQNESMTLAEAFDLARKMRPVTSPNPGFMRILIDLEKKMRGEVTIDLEKYKENRFAEVKNLGPDEDTPPVAEEK